MAKKLKPEAHRSIGAEELRRVIREAQQRKAEASEASGRHGKVISGAVEQYGLERNALTFARRLADMEEGKRQSVLRALIEYSGKLGFFDQLDAFDDLVATLRGIVDAAEGNRPNTGAARDGAPAELVP